MRMSDQNTAIANDLRKQIQSQTDSIDDGESVAIILLWTFLLDHAKCHGIDAAQLAREQLEAFIPYAEKNIKLVREH